MIFNNEEYIIKVWKNEYLGNIVSIDTETEEVPFHMTPRLATIQAYSGKTNEVFYVPRNKLRLFLNKHYSSILVMHNASFDMDVMGKELQDNSIIHELYDRNRIHDTSILYRLLHLGTIGFIPFKYNLALLTEKFLGTKLNKDNEVRCNFFQYRDTDILDIPEEFLEYGAKDVIATQHIYFSLVAMIKDHDTFNTLLSQDIQVKGELALNHIYKNGIGFDLLKRDEWLKDMDTKLNIEADKLATWGWVRGKKGIKDQYERIVEQIGIANLLPRTEDGSISSKADDLESYKGNHFVDAFLNHSKLEKATTFVRNLSSSRVHPRYNSLVNTGRTSCSKPNFQQLPRVGGIREMFIADPGKTFLITDYSTLELATLSQVMYERYGASVMMDKINGGEDLHKFYASVMNGCEIDEVTKEQRQEAKAANFGYPGGLGTTTFIQFAAGYGLTITESEAITMKNAWHDAFPETREYLTGEQGSVYTLTGRKRGNTTFCAEKNTPFQGLAADGAKLALYNLDKAGFKIVGFCHDEIITEVSIDKAEELLKIQERIMIDSMRIVTPDVRIAVESQISPHYCK